VFEQVLSELTEGDGESQNLDFSEDFTAVTIVDGETEISCAITDNAFDCTLSDDMITYFESIELIGEDDLSSAGWPGVVTRSTEVGGYFDSQTGGELTLTLAVTCEGSCPAQVNIAAYGIVYVPCSSTHTTRMTSP
jgi:hypothetical protein